ncbi:dihydropteroate synthase [Mycobacterium sp. 21AC1]|uniref:dihydropteroate synthase n=1 Tax=[Mycobacterium] appelbergii TaxID=2939269 RepID=UPI0029390167|nr:dihydropteroate synthase [Mycobacterium sp. 21AC1]MDV3129949.1 dihydropteroate synthase [Mycobacterium sp. 21AC1]
MGILNVTPDSFSDGGRYLAVNDAVEHGLSMIRHGADVVDVGGESTRPGAQRITESEELRRVLTVVRALAGAGIPVTIDTMRSRVAAAALAAGAVGVNDVSGGLADPDMPAFISDARVPYVLSHWRAANGVLSRHAEYQDVVGDVITDLRRRLDVFECAGADLDRIVIDPGLGFAKTAGHNWQILRRLGEIRGIGHRVLIGASRKSFLRNLLAADDGGVTPRDLDAATAVVSALAAAAGAYGVRVHDVTSTALALKTSAAWVAGDSITRGKFT